MTFHNIASRKSYEVPVATLLRIKRFDFTYISLFVNIESSLGLFRCDRSVFRSDASRIESIQINSKHGNIVELLRTDSRSRLFALSVET